MLGQQHYAHLKLFYHNSLFATYAKHLITKSNVQNQWESVLYNVAFWDFKSLNDEKVSALHEKMKSDLTFRCLDQSKPKGSFLI